MFLEPVLPCVTPFQQHSFPLSDMTNHIMPHPLEDNLGFPVTPGLWSSEVAYRRSVAKFGDVSEAAHRKAAGLTRKLREEGERFRALSKRPGGVKNHC